MPFVCFFALFDEYFNLRSIVVRQRKKSFHFFHSFFCVNTLILPCFYTSIFVFSSFEYILIYTHLISFFFRIYPFNGRLTAQNDRILRSQSWSFCAISWSFGELEFSQIFVHFCFSSLSFSLVGYAGCFMYKLYNLNYRKYILCEFFHFRSFF